MPKQEVRVTFQPEDDIYNSVETLPREKTYAKIDTEEEYSHIYLFREMQDKSFSWLGFKKIPWNKMKLGSMSI